ncbi:NADPH-dependent FMN reductase [Phreatobacter stygius]|uniref:NADPH-dependent FMN reductase n=1 Tax=Phreatobacter stygius TaxID=1940610 RepID=A0A4D7BEZ7_9HYPH|nr:NADPH-dependent FMN reductase [Phreatobacter stygius]QCI68478.1 NADPH-dependent FMN reductase [Phreatobacter stygius]
MLARPFDKSGRKLSVVAISGSPSPASTTAMLADYALGQLPARSFHVRHIRLRDIDAAALLGARPDEAGLAEAIDSIEAADGIIVATPIYKAAYSGLLKAFLDVLPQFGLAGKTVLQLATGGSLAHVLALDYALRPVLQSMGARHIVQSTFVAAGQMQRSDAGLVLEQEAATLLNEAILHFRHSVMLAPTATLLGHPRPVRQHAAE